MTTATGVLTVWKGDRACYTGHSEDIYGAVFYEVLLLEGASKGQARMTQRDPRIVNPMHRGDCPKGR